MNENWLLGFIEGEGCFVMGFARDKKFKFGICCRPYFNIGLTKADEGALYQIKELLGYGQITYISHEKQRNEGKNFKDEVDFTIVSLPQCKKLRDLLTDLEWHTKKEKDFRKWSECLNILDKKEHWTKEGILKLARLRETMNLKEKTHPNYIHATDLEKHLEKYKRSCRGCGKDIVGKTGQLRYCSDDCKRKNYNQRCNEIYYPRSKRGRAVQKRKLEANQ